MTRLFFIRHAEPDYNVRDDFNRPLTKSGVLSAKNIPEVFIDIELEHLYSSPFLRAVETIRPLAEKRNIDIILRPNLRERDVGIWVDNFLEYAEKQWLDFDYKIEGGESLRTVQKRNIHEITEILNNHQNQNTAIGTHGTALCTILNYFDKQYDFSFFKSVVNKTPYFIEMKFNNLDFISAEEMFIESSEI